MDIDKEIHTLGSESLDDLFSNQGIHPTINFSGGIGGAGGAGGVNGGVGGEGQGPRLYLTNAEQFTLNLNRSEQALVHGNYRKIPWGDIYLQRQLYVSRPEPEWLLYSPHPRYSTRKVQSARINGQNFTAVNYEGTKAEKILSTSQEWKEDVERYMKFRHENILQVYGIVRDQKHDVYATIFHGGLSLKVNWLLIFWQEGFNYFESISGYPAGATGHLCLDVGMDTSPTVTPDTGVESLTIPPINFLSFVDANIIVESLALEDYHMICGEMFSKYQYYMLSSTCPIHMGSVNHAVPDVDLDNSVEIASLLPSELKWDAHWQISRNQELHKHIGFRVRGWTRFLSSELSDLSWFWFPVWYPHSPNLWLSQANHIFYRSAIKSNFDNYASFKWPECPAYWSLDSSGVERLSTEEASRLGFPVISPKTEFYGWSWEDSVYTGLREFHQAKGFHPDSQDVARHLKYPLFDLSSKAENAVAIGVQKSTGKIEEISSGEDDFASVTDQEELSKLAEGCPSGDLQPEVDGTSTASKEREKNFADDSDRGTSIDGPEYNGQEHNSKLQESTVDLAERMPVSKAFKIITTIQIVLICVLGFLALVERIIPFCFVPRDVPRQQSHAPWRVGRMAGWMDGTRRNARRSIRSATGAHLPNFGVINHDRPPQPARGSQDHIAEERYINSRRSKNIHLEAYPEGSGSESVAGGGAVRKTRNDDVGRNVGASGVGSVLRAGDARRWLPRNKGEPFVHEKRFLLVE
ncbi:hypothetical protein R3P38DRAFT_2794044 [Favolaschia claudopus]|uniref:Uncharacterized protein n=1 Tax=Favolaschia claudopus TaxID=2862362 RepID=A0AAW0ABT4_9AGAR